MNDIVNRWLTSLDVVSTTRETYKRNIRRWLSWLESNGCTVERAKRETILAYKTELTAECKPLTINGYLTAVRSLYAFLEAEGVMPNIAAGVKGVRRNRNSPKDALTRDQAAALLSRPASSLEELRNAAIVELMLRRGLRAVEVTRADIGDIRQVAGQAVLYIQCKGHNSKDEAVFLGRLCLASISAYLERRGCGDLSAPLFAGVGNRNQGGRLTTRAVSGICKSAMKEAGISSPRLTAHSLRHTAVTLAQVGGATIQDVARLMKHNCIDSTVIYDHTEANELRAAEALDTVLELKGE